MAATARGLRSDRGNAATKSSGGTTIRCLAFSEIAGWPMQLAAGGRHVGSVAVAVCRSVVGPLLQFHRAVAVRFSILLLVPVRLGADHLGADLAGLSQPAA